MLLLVLMFNSCWDSFCYFICLFCSMNFVFSLFSFQLLLYYYSRSISTESAHFTLTIVLRLKSQKHDWYKKNFSQYGTKIKYNTCIYVRWCCSKTVCNYYFLRNLITNQCLKNILEKNVFSVVVGCLLCVVCAIINASLSTVELWLTLLSIGTYELYVYLYTRQM